MVSNAVIVDEADKENVELDGVLTAAEADGCNLRGKFRKLQTECRAAHSGGC